MVRGWNARRRLRGWRVEQGHSREDVGELIGASWHTVAEIECGRRSPGRELANRIKAVVGIPQEAWDALDPEPASAS